MTFIDILLRARRPASLVAFNNALPANFKILARNDDDTAWVNAPGVEFDVIDPFELEPAVVDGNGDIVTPAVISPDYHVNLRISDPIYSRLLLNPDNESPDDPDPELDKHKIRRWFRNNGVEQLHDGQGDFAGWWRWTDGTEWVDIARAKPNYRRRIWFGDAENPEV